MRRKFSDEQIAEFLKQADSGVSVTELCRHNGFSDTTFYNWRSKFGSKTISKARRLKDLQAENALLKRLLSESILTNEMLKTTLHQKREP